MTKEEADKKEGKLGIMLPTQFLWQLAGSGTSSSPPSFPQVPKTINRARQPHATAHVTRLAVCGRPFQEVNVTASHIFNTHTHVTAYVRGRVCGFWMAEVAFVKPKHGHILMANIVTGEAGRGLGLQMCKKQHQRKTVDTAA